MFQAPMSNPWKLRILKININQIKKNLHFITVGILSCKQEETINTLFLF